MSSAGQKFRNYLGQLRLYSLADLILLLLAAQASGWEMVGVLLLWIGFLFFLEDKHKHAYREPVKPAVWVGLLLGGGIIYGRVEAVLFIALAYLYSLKTRWRHGLYAPVARGLQSFFLVAGLVGYGVTLPWLALILTTIRNIAGDFRDTEKDRREKMITLPVQLGYQRGFPNIHLIALMLTSFVWWLVGDFSVLLLLVAWAVALGTYHLTPR